MKKSQRMKPIASIAHSEQKRVAIELGEAQLKLQSQEARLLELSNYLQAYQGQFIKNSTIRLNPSQVLNYQQFIENLRRAIAEQMAIAKNAMDDVNDKRQQWFDSRNKVKVFEKVISRYQSEEDKLEDRREQREHDELSQRKVKGQR
jgi:flagellar FliJ protein